MSRWNEEFLEWLESAVKSLRAGKPLLPQEKDALIQSAEEVLSDNERA